MGIAVTLGRQQQHPEFLHRRAGSKFFMILLSLLDISTRRYCKQWLPMVVQVGIQLITPDNNHPAYHFDVIVHMFGTAYGIPFFLGFFARRAAALVRKSRSGSTQSDERDRERWMANRLIRNFSARSASM